MVGWNPSYNWSYDELKKTIEQCFGMEKENYIHLDVEHSDSKNINDIISWAKQLGYEAEEAPCETVKVWKP